jgi:hypothetical protein
LKNNLRCRGCNLDDAPVAKHEFVNLGTNPVDSERYETDVVVGIEALDRLHEADVAFLDQVAERQAVTGIAFRNVYDKAQVRQDELTRRIEVVFLAEPDRQRLLVFLAEHGHGTDCLNIGVEAADRSGQHQFVVSKRYSCRHSVLSLWYGNFSTRDIRVLTGAGVPPRCQKNSFLK